MVKQSDMKDSESFSKLLPRIIFAFIGLVAFIAIFSFFQAPSAINKYLINSLFFTSLGVIGVVLVFLIRVSYNPSNLGEEDMNMKFKFMLYIVSRIIAISLYIYINAWIAFVSPFSFLGGSLYGGLMQLIIMLPIGFLFINFWATFNYKGLFLISVAIALMFPLSFMFPTMFSNFYAISTGSSAALGGTVMSNFAVVDPMSYYRSSVLAEGITEPVTGPTYEQVTDDVVSVDVSIDGRMCDDSQIVTTVRLDNEAKYKLENIYVHISPVKDVYANLVGADYDLCSTNFVDETSGSTRYYGEFVPDLPKGAPATVTAAFTTHLPADVLSQICSMRTDVVLSYHTTSVFPITFIDYNMYLINPTNIGNPVSTSSFGKVKINLDVGEQPIPIQECDYAECISECENNCYNDCSSDYTSCLSDCGDDELGLCESSCLVEKTNCDLVCGDSDCSQNCESCDELLLKVGWSQKGDGSVLNPKIYLFLPPDLGACQDHPVSSDYLEGSLSSVFGVDVPYTGALHESSFSEADFKCYTSEEYDCNRFSSTINLQELSQDPLLAITDYVPSNEQSLSVPGVEDTCEELVENMGYTICETTFNPSSSDLLLCWLDLSNVQVNEIDMNTYLVRADAIYEFHDVTTTNYQVENCDAI